MALVDSLLTAIVRADGDALVLHAGERPYVVAPTGQSELASRVLTLDAMIGMVGELLPEEARHALEELGAVQHELPPSTVAKGESFTVVAARGGDDIWMEIRRHRKPIEQPKPEIHHDAVPAAQAPASVPPPIEIHAEAEPAVHETHPDVQEMHAVVETHPDVEEMHPVVETHPDVEEMHPVVEMHPAVEEMHPVVEMHADVHETQPDLHVRHLDAPAEFLAFHEIDLDAASVEIDLDAVAVDDETLDSFEPTPEVMKVPEPVKTPELIRPAEPVKVSEPVKPPERVKPLEPVQRREPVKVPEPMKASEPVKPPEPAHAGDPELSAEPSMDRHSLGMGGPSVSRSWRAPETEFESQPAVVLPLALHAVRNEQAARFAPPLHTAGIDRLLRIAAARGASTLYLSSQARPSIRVDGEISAVEGEAVLSEPDVEALILDIIPERNRETLRTEAGTEWICDVPDVGRIRCVTFRDHRGAGGIFRMIPARAISAEQLGLSREIQGLCAEAEGLLLITGPRSSGKSTLISAFVDLINRTRSAHVVTLENQIKFVHENRLSLVSQREVRGDNTEWMVAARAALRENPDVLVIEDLRSPEVVALALDAAQSGHLVIGALTAHTTTEAVDRIIDQTPPERRPKIQLGLAEALRGVVGQVLLRKSGGGRVAAREVLLNTRAVANLIAEGKTSQLPMAIDSGRKHGMVPLNDALASFVQNGIVDSREAYRQASDQQGFLGLLRRQGIDTSFVERLA